MSIVTITPLSSINANLTISQNSNTSTVVTSPGSDISIVTINQGSPGPPGPAGSGIFDIIGGYGINVTSIDDIYTISSTLGMVSSTFTINNDGRLTLQSGDPINNNDISSSTLYYTPYLGNKISLYDISTTSWESYSFSETTLSLSGMSSGFNYDIFIYYSGGNIILEKVQWLNNNTRNINLAYQDGVLVRSGSINKRYLGTIRSTSSNTTEDSSSRRLVFNFYNQINKILLCYDNVSHTYTSSTVRPYRNLSTLGLTRCEFVSGINYRISIICRSLFSTEITNSSVGIGLDSTSVFNTDAINTTHVGFSLPASTLDNTTTDYINISPGYHYLQLLQNGSNITTFYHSSLKALLSC